MAARVVDRDPQWRRVVDRDLQSGSASSTATRSGSVVDRDLQWQPVVDGDPQRHPGVDGDPQRDHGPRRRVRCRPSRGGRGARRLPGRIQQRPGRVREGAEAGLATLADPEYLAGQRRVAPGIGAVHGVRWPLLAAVARGFGTATKGERATPLLFIADRLFRERELEARWFAFGLLERTLADETERTWQLLRRAAREAGDWITVDSLAHPYGKGIAAEPYRWAELEQLVYSPSRWERRLVGSTIATMTHVDRKRGRDPEVARHALPLLASLMGDAEPDVQKALAWAYRAVTVVDRPATEAALRAETGRADATADGHRAWVIRRHPVKARPTRRTSSAPASPGSASARGPRHLLGGSRRPARSATFRSGLTHPEPPLYDPDDTEPPLIRQE